jgi:hypothetical protein
VTDALAAIDAIRNGAMETKDSESSKLSDEWDAVSGGVLSLVATIAEPQLPLIFDDRSESGHQ